MDPARAPPPAARFGGAGRLLLFATPAGFEQFVVELGEPVADWSSPPSAPPDMATLMAVAAKYRVDILGPLPDEAVPMGQAMRGSSEDSERSEAMSGEENAAVVERWIEAYNARDTRAEAAARAPGFVAHVPGVPVPLDADAWVGFTASFAAAFPDLRLTVEESFAAGDKVAARVTFRGTHRSEFQGIPPTDRQVTFSSIELNRMVDGKVAEHWVELDLLGLLRQLGAIPTPGTAGS
ncbi:MAG: hypothetical protein AVDCRST_MAG73-813 [uncultured Thermomicrobiales bacterium]|uniref:Ester cyclase n=1 Tax=uncultured Thermomicrobiales bacterium TaxID=1645740 RepID=A0A6J4TQI9_9BACT|nr:MAG: hypothetical protein AVDCRST_MAG73-813 [uncultured Thermomicrobiales bacterium]